MRPERLILPTRSAHAFVRRDALLHSLVSIMAIRTVFSMVEDCARGERLGWYEFVRDYAGITRTLLTHYFPMLTPEMDIHPPVVFEHARARNNAWVSALRFANEREFMMALREFIFAYGRSVARVPVPELSLDQMREIMKDLPVVEHELLWLFVKGYSAPQIAAIMMNAEATAAQTKGIADQRLAKILPGASPDAFNVSARVLIEAAEKVAGDKCLPWKTYNNLVNGQLTWRERELTEEHIRDCFYCLDRFTSFQEMIRLRKDFQPLPEPAIQTILARLALPAEKPKRLLSKLFARG